MKKCLVGVALAVVLGVFGFARPAQAALIDFTDAAAWGNVQGDNSFTALTLFDGVSVTVSAGLGSLTFNSGGDANALCSGATGLVCDGDGIGIGDDEVTSRTETLSVLFSSPVTVSGIALLDLFGITSGDPSAERARWVVYSPNAGATNSTTGTDTGSLGYRSVVTNFTNVSRIDFFATTPTNSDFALASLNIGRVAVTEPATLLMSMLGFAAVAAARSRRRRS